MSQEKTLKEAGKALRAIWGMDERRGLNSAILKQWGIGTMLKTFAKTPFKGDVMANLRDLKKFKIGKLAAYLFASLWESFGDREAIVDGERRITYMEMRNRVFSLANALQDLGVKPKDRVAVMLFNCAEYMEALYASSIIGAPMPALNWHTSGKELCDSVNLRKPRVFIFNHEFSDDVRRYKDRMKTVEHFIVVGGDKSGEFLNYERLIEEYPPLMPDVNFIIAINPYTGGTTGTAKSSNLYDGLSYLMSDVAEKPRATMTDYLGYLIKQYSYLYHCGAEEIEDPVGKNIRSLIPTPLYHAGTAAGYAPCLIFGATAVLMRKFDPEHYLSMIEKERISWSFIVPTILQRILELPDDILRKYDLSTMHTLICAAAPCPPDVKIAANALFLRQGAKRPVFHEYYGSSETALITLLLPSDYTEKPKRMHSVGKARCGDLMIYDEIERKEVPAGKDGLVMCRSVSTISLQYPGMEAKLSESIRMIDGVEWYDDGLIGRLDEDGFLYLTGRVKEMIICGGVNLYPKEIEEVLFRHPKIADCAVIRGPDPDLGEAPFACIQMRPGETATAGDIAQYCKDAGLKGFKIPRKIDFFETLPRHIDGKMIKRELEKKYWEGIERRG